MRAMHGMALAALAISGAAAATDPAPVDDDILVVGSTKEYRLTSKELRAAGEAFRKYRPRYAPQGELWFAVTAREPGAALDGLALRLVSDDAVIDLPLDHEGRFRLPEIDEAGWKRTTWRLTTNRPGLRIRLRPWVYSPSSSLGNWRLGDLQLQCRVGWAIARQSTSFIVAGMFDAIGGCQSGKVGIYYDLGRPIADASIREAARLDKVAFLKPSQLRLPTYLKGYGLEARVTVQFAR